MIGEGYDIQIRVVLDMLQNLLDSCCPITVRAMHVQVGFAWLPLAVCLLRSHAYALLQLRCSSGRLYRCTDESVAFTYEHVIPFLLLVWLRFDDLLLCTITQFLCLYSNNTICKLKFRLKWL